jgi:hypothetical protein
MATRASVSDESRTQTPVATEGRENHPSLIEMMSAAEKSFPLAVIEYRRRLGIHSLIGAIDGERTGRKRRVVQPVLVDRKPAGRPKQAEG